ncbi:MAG: nucleoside hydrolase [Erysipelotrichaceae bacterium]|nr:nucleoside hydrolase [Erysipelotrichaceae bacterium]
MKALIDICDTEAAVSFAEKPGNISGKETEFFFRKKEIRYGGKNASVSFEDLSAAVSSFKDILEKEEMTDVVLMEGGGLLASVLSLYPEAKEKISKIIYAGGAWCFGDVSPVAERSVYEDPEAMQALLRAGIPFYFVPLEVYEKTGKKYETAYLAALKPEVFDFVKYRAEVEVYADYTRGMTVIYRNGYDHLEIEEGEGAFSHLCFVKEEDKNAYYPEADGERIEEALKEVFG